MDTLSICVTFIAGILGIGFPILLEVVSRLDEKYSSVNIIDVFHKEKTVFWFWLFLISSLASIVIYKLELKPIADFGNLNLIVENSALGLLIVNTVILITLFFIFVNKILKYYTPSKIIPYLINDCNNEKTKGGIYFSAISDLLYFSIKSQNEKLAKTIAEFMAKSFFDFRNENSDKEIKYPVSYYEVIFKATEELGALNNKKFTFLEYRTVGSVWLLGELRYSKISETTYYWIWANLEVAIRYERDDMVMHHWGNAHQYFSFQLNHVPLEFNEVHEQTNSDEVEKRKSERERFLEFHHALGGVLLYRQRYKCIGRVFRYTTSIPPRYELLPMTMNEVFRLFMKYRDSYDHSFIDISRRYYFPEVEGLHGDDTVKYWMCNYIALLFLRQYSLTSFYYGMEPVQIPNLPVTQSDKREWMDNIDFFKMLIEEVYENRTLMENVGLKFLNDQWCVENHKQKPIEFIYSVKEKLNKSFEATKVEQMISEEKSKLFFDSSKRILRNTFEEYRQIFNNKWKDKEYNRLYVHGERTLFDKSAFAENQESTHLYFDTYLARKLSSKFKNVVSESFSLNKSASYLLKAEDIFKAIDKLKLKNSEYVIISFGLNINYLKETFNIEGLSETHYNGMEIIKVKSFNHHVVGESMFILKRSDLPHLIFREVEKELFQKYQSTPLNNKYLYGSVIDLNKYDALREEIKYVGGDGIDLKKMLLLDLEVKVEIRWKKNIKNVMLTLYSKYTERGLPNKLSDVK